MIDVLQVLGEREGMYFDFTIEWTGDCSLSSSPSFPTSVMRWVSARRHAISEALALVRSVPRPSTPTRVTPPECTTTFTATDTDTCRGPLGVEDTPDDPNRDPIVSAPEDWIL